MGPIDPKLGSQRERAKKGWESTVDRGRDTAYAVPPAQSRTGAH